MGYTWTRPKDYADHQRVMKAATGALAAQYGTQFKYGPISEVRTPLECECLGISPG